MGKPLPYSRKTEGILLQFFKLGKKIILFFPSLLRNLAQIGIILYRPSALQLFDHIRYMYLTTFPSFVITLLVFTVLGLVHGSGSAEQMEAEGWALSELTHDLHGEGPVGVMTDYEAKFYAEGMSINRLVATKTAATKGTAAGPVPRLRGASLVDARGYEQSAKESEA